MYFKLLNDAPERLLKSFDLLIEFLFDLLLKLSVELLANIVVFIYDFDLFEHVFDELLHVHY